MANETFTVTETTVLKPGGGDTDGDNVIDPGEIVRTTVTITNNSTTPTPVDAIGLQFSQTLNGMTLFDQVGLGDINVSPIAFNNSYTAIGNTLLEVGSATGQTGPQSSIAGHVTDNDHEFFGGTFTISLLNATAPVAGSATITTGNGGTVTMITSGVDMGSFTYISNDGFTGVDTFTYTIRDTGLDGIAGNADDLTSTATVTITVANQVWYVDSAAAAGGDGTSTNPFDSLADVSGLTGPDGDGDIIYVNTGTGDYTGGITLLDNQTLHGEGTALVVGGFTLAAAGTDATIVNAAGNGVTLEQGNTLTGFTVGNTTGYDIANTTTATVGVLTISNVTLNGSGGLIRVDSGGTLNVQLDSATTSNAGAAGILLSNVDNSTFTITGATTIDDATADGITIANSQNSTFTFTGAVTILNDAGGANGDGVDLLTNNAVDSIFHFNGGVDITVNGTSAFGFRAQSSGTVNILNPNGTNQITSNNGTAIFINPTVFNANLTSVTAGDGGTGDGIHLEGVSGTGVTIGTVSINGMAGDGIDITNSSANITINGGSIGNTNDPGGIGVDINGGAGNVTINATINDATDANDVIEVTGRTGGTIDFDGAITSTGGGIDINGNTGGTVRFDGGMNLDTAAIAAFNSTGNTGMTLVVTDTVSTANILATTTGTALNVSNTTIGAEDLTFQSISSNGAANGILLNTTGSLGGLTVTGDGGGANNGSGGTIQNTTGDAISLTSTMDVMIARMNLTNNDGMGINGNVVNGLVLTRLNITGNGDSAAADEGGIRLLELTGDATHLTQFNNIVVTNSFEHNVFIRNTTGTLTDLVVTGSTFSNNGASTQAGMHFIFEAASGGLAGTPTMTAHFTNNTFTGSTTVGQLTSHALQAAANEGTVNVHIGNGTVGGRNTFTTNAVGIDLDTSGTGNLNFDVNNNVLTDTTSNAINIFRGASSTGTVHGFVRNNVIGTQGVATSGSELGAGVRVGSEGGGVTRILIDSNTIQSIGVNGVSGGPNIDLTQGIAGPPGGYVEGTLHATVINNILRDNADSRAMNATARNGTINVDFHGNTLSGIVGQSGTFVRLSADALVASDDGLINVPQASTAAIAAANTGLTAAQIATTPPVNFSQPAPLLPNATPLLAGGLPPPEDSSDQGGKTGDGTGGGFVPPTPGPEGEPVGDGEPAADPAPPAPTPAPVPADGNAIVVDDGYLSQAELDFFVDAAIERWAATGLTAEQVAALEGLTFQIAEMSGLYLGSYDGGVITLDNDGAGRGWYADATPLEDSEFANAASATRLIATPGTPPAGRFDLLTTILHEMGHALGLSDLYDDASRDELLYGYLFAGERRLPGADDADGAIVGSVTSEAFAGSLIQVLPADANGGVFTLPAGQSVTIQWDATIDLQQNQLIVNPVNQGTVSATNPPAAFPDANSNSVTTTLDTLTLGGTVWNDNGGVGGTANNGLKDGTEDGIDGVAVSLFVDADNNDVPDAPGTPLVTGVTTTGGGNYSFTGLAPGNYIVRVDSSNFGTVLGSSVTSPGSPDPDAGEPDTDNDDNGFLSGGAVFSNAITLAYNSEPTAGMGNDTNNTLDFGFVPLNQAPVHIVPGAQAINEEAPRTFSAGVGNQISVNDPDVGAGNLTVALSVAHGTLSLNGIVGLSFTVGTGTNDAAMTFSGTQAAVNTALNGLVYTPTTHFNGADTLTITTNDNGNTGVDPGLSGDTNSEQDSDTVAITIADVNDAPTVGGDGTETAPSIAVDTPVGRTVSSLFASQFSDALDVQVSGGNPTGSTGDSFGGIAVSGNVTGNAAGEWQFHDGAVWADIGARTSSNALIINGADQIRFNPSSGYTGPAPDLTAHLVETGAAVTTGTSIDLGAIPPGGTTQISTGTVVLSQNVAASVTPPVANNDAFTTNEATAVTASNLFADNGSGADADPDGDPFSVTHVNGAAVVGSQITLSSGALLTVNANGTFNYNPNGVFNFLPAAGSGASNTQATDSFTYTITEGATATATITINGLDSNDTLFGTPGADTLDGGNGNDYIDGAGGDDLLSGGVGADVIDGKDGVDRIHGGDDGDYVAGGADNDVIHGEGGDDVLNGDAGDDHIDGGDNDDRLYGGIGGDFLLGGLGADLLDGGDQNDVLYGGAGEDRLLAGAGDDIVEGGADADIAYGGLGADTMHGQDGADYLDGEDGDDILEGGSGADVIDGKAGADRIRGGADADYVAGGADGDVIDGDAGDDVLNGDAGADYLDGGADNDELYGGADGDFIRGGTGNDLVEGGTGIDLIYGEDGDDRVYAGDGDDTVLGGAGFDVIYGGAGADQLYGEADGDYLDGEGEDDLLVGGAGIDILLGGEGHDHLFGGTEDDDMFGGGGDDVVYGEAGNDELVGNGGVDFLDGGAGDDSLDGGLGADTLVGGADMDRFIFSTALGGGNIDTVFGFEAGVDTILLDDAVFTGLGVGGLPAGAFVVGTAAQDADDRIIYDSATGALYFDADGDGIGAQVQFATLAPAPTLTASDFIVI